MVETERAAQLSLGKGSGGSGIAPEIHGGRALSPRNDRRRHGHRRQQGDWTRYALARWGWIILPTQIVCWSVRTSSRPCLAEKGFYRVVMRMAGESGWGDALYANARKLGFARILQLRAKGVIFNLRLDLSAPIDALAAEFSQGDKQDAAPGTKIPLIAPPGIIGEKRRAKTYRHEDDVSELFLVGSNLCCVRRNCSST